MTRPRRPYCEGISAALTVNAAVCVAAAILLVVFLRAGNRARATR